MGYIKRLKLSFLSVVFLIFIPLIILISSGMAVLNYKQSYAFIIDIIDNKLVSIASVTASFIDGDEYKKVLEAKEIKAYASIGDTLYALGQDNKLYTIEKKLGAARAIEGLALDFKILDIASYDENLYALSANKIYQIDLKDKSLKELQSFDMEFSSFSFKNPKEIYLSNKNKLYLYRDSKIGLLNEFDNPISSINYFEDKLYFLYRDENKIAQISLDDFSSQDIEFEEFPSETTDALAFSVTQDKIYMGDRHLVVYDKKEETLEHEDFARMFRDEGLYEYKKYHEPMTEIKLALDLTYHYTVNLLYGDSENNSFYIFDVHAGNEYSPIGSYDFMDLDDLKGAEDVIYRDLAYVGDVKLWEKWGLLKVAYAGIKDSEGNIVGVTGTDVDITFIKSKTHEALVHSITIGLITLVFSIFASYYIALKILKPIEKLKSSALKIAAGKYDEKLVIDSPSELSELSDGFNYMSEQLTLEIKNFKNYTLDIKQRKENEKLYKKLHYLNSFEDSKVQIIGDNIIKNPHGVIMFDHSYYAWAGKDESEQKLEIIKKSAVINDMLGRILKSHGDLNDFIGVNGLESFVKINPNISKIFDLVNNQEQEYNTQIKSEINVGDMHISISPIDFDRSR